MPHRELRHLCCSESFPEQNPEFTPNPRKCMCIRFRIGASSQDTDQDRYVKIHFSRQRDTVLTIYNFHLQIRKTKVPQSEISNRKEISIFPRVVQLISGRVRSGGRSFCRVNLCARLVAGSSENDAISSSVEMRVIP